MQIIKKEYLALIVILVVLVVALCLNTGSNAKNSSKEETFDNKELGLLKLTFDPLIFSYDTFLQKSFNRENLPGMAVTIVKEDQVLLMKGFGVKEFGDNDSIDVNTVFRLGSVSKGFASVLTEMFVKEKVISWDDKIIKYLPDFSLADSAYTTQLTIRQILSHTSGLPVHTYTDLLDRDVPYEEIKPLLKEVKPFAPPGKYYSYQNVVYSLIADIIKSATGKNYLSLMAEKVFMPLCMENASSDYFSIRKNNNVAKPHVKIGFKKWKAIALNDRYYSVPPASGINASISDMSIWLLALIGNYPDILPKEALEEIYTPQIKTFIKWKFRRNWKNIDSLYYALGWRVFEYNNKKIIYHGGYVKGYRAEIAVDMKDKVGIAVLFNSSCRLANSCIPTFLDMYNDFYKKEKVFAGVR